MTITSPLRGLGKQAEDMQCWVLCGEAEKTDWTHCSNQPSLVQAQLL